VARGALDLEPVARGLLCLFLVWVLAKGLTVGAIPQYDLVNKLGGIILLFSFYVCLTTLADGGAKSAGS